MPKLAEHVARINGECYRGPDQSGAFFVLVCVNSTRAQVSGLGGRAAADKRQTAGILQATKVTVVAPSVPAFELSARSDWPKNFEGHSSFSPELGEVLT
jgi:hypothetical protein